MNLDYKVELGMFGGELRLDDDGIFLQRGPRSQQLRWEQIYGAALLPKGKKEEQELSETAMDPRALQMLGGPEVLAKMRELQDKFQTMVVAYRDERGHREILEFPLPLEDPRFLQEITARVGSGWLGEVRDRDQAEKKLGTAPGFFKVAFVLIALLAGVVLLGAFGFFSLLGPAFNFLSIQRMLLDLQDGEYTSFAMRLLTYVVLFVFAFLIRRWWRSRTAGMRAKYSSLLRR